MGGRLVSEKPADMFDLSAGVPPSVGASIEGDISPKPKASIGMSKKIIGVIFVIIAMVVVIFLLSIEKIEQKGIDRTKDAAEATESKKEASAAMDTPTDLKSKQVAGAITAIVPTELLGGSAAVGSVPAALANPSAVPAVSGGNSGRAGVVPSQVPAAGASNGVGTPEEQAAQRRKMERDQRLAEAKQSGLESKGFNDSGSQGAKNANDLVLDAIKGRMDAALLPPQIAAGNGQNQPQGDQEQKLKFMKEGGVAPAGQHAHTVVEPKSRYELHSGSFIPAILEMGVNSDLPGLVTARVRENVYASVDHRHLLIPSTSKLVGSYDSRVALGQSRQLVVWNTLIYPDGKELNLAGLPTADVSGQSGLEADVDNHWFRLFGVTFGMSMVTAGVQLSVPQQSAGSNGQAPLSSAQIVSQALAQQYGQLGGQVMGRYLQVQPTLRNYPGERFNIVVPLKITFPGPWTPKYR
jgi:type IV secretory pathway VirB10-like protein